MKPTFTYSPNPVLEPVPDCDWASNMVLNPAIIKDKHSNALHMLFRATGPAGHMKLQGSPFDPYPIFLGYAVSHDNGDTWDADFSRPALSPKLSYDIDGMYITDDEGNKVVNYANGCIEDPRIFQVEGKLYISAACRMFPPGPYWIDDPAIGTTHTNIPAWAKEKDNPFGSVALYNETVTVLYALDLDRLIERDYDNAFTYICPLTDGNVDDNRDVFPFPEKMTINGTEQYVLIHRPHNPSRFAAGKGYTTPSVMMAAAANIKDFATEKATHQFTATSIFDWEEERIGGSWPPIKLNENEWLFAYHGKQYPGYGYSQSFMILTRAENEFPTVKHRCSERLMYAKQPWEMPDKFACPCIFTTAGIVVDGTLIMSYGAADQKVGICKVNFEELVRYIRLFDEKGASRG